MRRLVFALLCGLVLVPLPVHAQGSVTLTVCNTGTVDIDVFLSGTGTHIRPATCVAVAQATGAAQPAYIGIAFTDSRGQWGAARRFDGIPYMGSKDLDPVTKLAMRVRGEPVPSPVNVLSLATRIETVPHGNANVALPMQLLFQPPVPYCRTGATGGGTTLGRTTVVEVATICEDLGYTLKVEAFPDSREIGLWTTNVSGLITQDGPIRIRTEKTVVNWAQEEAARKRREEPPPVNWSDLLPALRRTQGAGTRLRDVLPRYIIIRGTVSSVEFDATTNIVFRESPFVTLRADWKPYSEFNVCTDRLDVLQERFGADFRTNMIGKAIEVQGEINDGGCRGQRGSIRIFLAHQVRPVPSALFAADARVWVPPPLVPPSVGFDARFDKAPLDPKALELQERRGACAEQAAKAYPNFHLSSERWSAYTKAAQDCMDNGIVPTAPPTPTPAAAPVTAPAKPAPAPAPVATPDNAAAARAKALQEEQQRAAQERLAAQRKSAQEAQQRTQKAQACMQELLKAHPDGGRNDPAGFQKGLLACAQIQQAGPAK